MHNRPSSTTPEKNAKKLAISKEKASFLPDMYGWKTRNKQRITAFRTDVNN